MQSIKSFLGEKFSILRDVTAENEAWQFIASLVILVVGFVVFEMLWRYVKNKTVTLLERKQRNLYIPYCVGFLQPLRLVSVVVLIWIAQITLVLPLQLYQLIVGLESFLLAIAAIFLSFQDRKSTRLNSSHT